MSRSGWTPTTSKPVHLENFWRGTTARITVPYIQTGNHAINTSEPIDPTEPMLTEADQADAHNVPTDQMLTEATQADAHMSHNKRNHNLISAKAPKLANRVVTKIPSTAKAKQALINKMVTKVSTATQAKHTAALQAKKQIRSPPLTTLLEEQRGGNN